MIIKNKIKLDELISKHSEILNQIKKIDELILVEKKIESDVFNLLEEEELEPTFKIGDFVLPTKEYLEKCKKMFYLSSLEVQFLSKTVFRIEKFNKISRSDFRISDLGGQYDHHEYFIHAPNIELFSIEEQVLLEKMTDYGLIAKNLVAANSKEKDLKIKDKIEKLKNELLFWEKQLTLEAVVEKKM